MSKRVQLVSDNDRLFPVQAFFNAISSQDFVEVIRNLLRGVGTGVNVAYCEFPGGVELGEESFEGVRFSLHEDEVIVDEAVFKRFLVAACKAYVRENPEARSDLIRELNTRGWPGDL